MTVKPSLLPPRLQRGHFENYIGRRPSFFDSFHQVWQSLMKIVPRYLLSLTFFPSDEKSFLSFS